MMSLISYSVKGGNDYEIYSDPRTKGYSVTNPVETRAQLSQLFG
jgi:phosphomannomutase